MGREKLTLEAELRKEFGNDSVIDESVAAELGYIPDGLTCQSAMLCLIIGRPAFPAGRLTELMGVEGVAKSTAVYHIIAECQRRGGWPILVENEDKFEIERLHMLGIDTSRDKMTIVHPESIEQGLSMMRKAIISLREKRAFTGPIALVWDSVSSACTNAELEAEEGDKVMASAARVLHQGLRRLNPIIAKHKIVAIFVNHLIANLDRYSGDRWVSYGGKAIKKYASLRIILKARKSDLEIEKQNPVGQWIIASNVKNSIGTPFKATKFFLNFKRGIDQYRDAWYFGIASGLFKEVGKGRISYKGKIITKEGWKKYVDKKWSDIHSCRDSLIKKAIKHGILEPYGDSLSNGTKPKKGKSDE